jgi:thiamine biosynthesis lipoprotein
MLLGSTLKTRVYLAFWAASALIGLTAVAQPAPQLFTITHPAMGTVFTLYIYAANREEADAKANPVFAEVDRLDSLLSNYKETSEISRINRLASEQSVTTDPETFEFLSESLKWSARSDGAFDITVGKLMKAWGFFRKQGRIPTKAGFKKLGGETGWRKVRLDARTRTVRFTSSGVELDPGGIGKGFAVDKAVAVLRSEQVSAAMLSAGSSTIYALGAPPGKTGWKVEVPDPRNPAIVLSTVTLRDTSLSSANCSEKHFILNGHLYCHIMDPKTLRPVEGMLQVTVMDPSATNSDALSNVLFVRKPEENAPLMSTLPEDSALVITGTQQQAACHLMNWKAAVAPGRC